MLNRSCQEVAGGTFHSLAYKILRIYGEAIGLKKPLTVLDRKDSEDLVGKIIKTKKWEKEKDTPGKKEFMELLSRLVNRGQTFEDGLSNFYFENGTSRSPSSRKYTQTMKILKDSTACWIMTTF